ncbi:MAG: gamma-glutamyl-gamma-aminobutyrate hydrolase family protein, partial [Pseudomonadota bacterium]
RDALEHRIIGEAMAANMPVLGICRGAQMLNIALGGTLYQSAYEVFTESRKMWTVLPRRTVEIMPESRFARLAGTEPMSVNALHSQAVDRLGDGLRVVARDTGGMVQAIERESDPFAIGVQWHPEHLPYARRQRRLFAGLVEAAAAYRTDARQTRAVDDGFDDLDDEAA